MRKQRYAASCAAFLLCVVACGTTPLMAQRYTEFAPLPDVAPIGAAWPTPNQNLFDAPDRFFAHTRVNPDYGRPGWTRNCGARFHRGCDIAPVQPIPTGQTAVVEFTNCETGEEYPSEEPVFLGNDPIFNVYAGVVEEAIANPRISDLGSHVVMRHRWPDGATFYTLYAHLSEIAVSKGQRLTAGERIGTMGDTSRSEGARIWLSIAPHLHFEVWNHDGQPLDPVAFLETHLAR